MTRNEFYDQICSLKDNFENKDSETYLLALLKLLQQEKNKLSHHTCCWNFYKKHLLPNHKNLILNWLNITSVPD